METEKDREDELYDYIEIVGEAARNNIRLAWLSLQNKKEKEKLIQIIQWE